MDTERLSSTPEAARELQIDPATLWRWLKAGRVSPTWTTPGGKYRWDLDDLRRQLGMPVTPRPIVLAVVTSDEGVLVAERVDGSPRWTLIGGEIEPMETALEAAIREVAEEACLRVMASSDGPIGERVHPQTGRTVVYVPCAPVAATRVEVGDVEELSAVRWVSLAEAEQLLSGLYEPVMTYLAGVLRGHAKA